MRITKKAIQSAPRFVLGVDYTAAYKPMTIDLFPVEADNVYDAMVEVCKHWDDTKVWCMSLYERTDETEGGYIAYKERIITYEGIDWRVAVYGGEVWYGVSEQKPMFREDRNL